MAALTLCHTIGFSELHFLVRVFECSHLLYDFYALIHAKLKEREKAGHPNRVCVQRLRRADDALLRVVSE